MRALMLTMAAGALLATPGWADETKDQATVHDGLDEMIRKKAPDLIKHLRSKNYTNVGVLKFLVKKGDAPLSDNVGELNLGVANRLEIALVLNNPDEDLGIIQHASKTVAQEKNTKANHLTMDGRKAFFTGQYDLAWGSRKVAANAFITGEVLISKDHKKTTVRLQVFEKDGNISNIGEEIAFDTPTRVLTEAGYSYLLTAEKDGPALETARKSKGNRFAAAVVVEKAIDPLENFRAFNDPASVVAPPPMRETLSPYKEGPVKLTVLYDGKPQQISTDGVVAEPTKDTVIAFLLENTTRDTYAVLLKLNGVNTLFQETISDPKACHKWVLEPGEKQMITGFQMTAKTDNKFKVLPHRESEENVVHYGDHAGTFRMACFKGSVTKEDPTVEINKQREEPEVARLAIARGVIVDLNDVSAGSLAALKKTLKGREKQADGARGLIVKSDMEGHKEVEKKFFKYEFADPMHDVTVRYYTPSKK